MTETFTFDNILIKPKSKSRVKSRAMVDTTTAFYDIELPMPVLSASMSLFDTSDTDSNDIFWGFAEAMYAAGGLHVLSRGSTLHERLAASQVLPDSGIEFGIAVSYQEFQVHQATLEDTEAFISIDIANGSIIEDIDWQGKYPLILGNFGNPGVLQRRDLKGELIYKFGIGSGSGCTTRLVTGVGAPQGWLIQEATRWHDKPIISDGGVKNVGDFVKAVALGADAVMLGRLFAGAKETPWEPVKIQGRWYKPYRGMASAEEKKINSYVEGVSGYVPYEDKSVKDIMQELSDGLRSAMAYVDALDLPEFQSQVEFFRVSEEDREAQTRLENIKPSDMIGFDE